MGNYGQDGNTLGEAGEVGRMHSEKSFEKCYWSWQENGERQNLVTRSCYAFNLALIQIHESLYVWGFFNVI